MSKYLTGAAVAALLLTFSNAFLARTAAQPEGLPSMPQVGDRLYVQGQVKSPCTVTAVHGDWVDCDGYFRNLVTGSAYAITERAK